MTDPFDSAKTGAAFDAGFRALGEVVYFFQQLEDDLGDAVSFLIDPGDSTTANIVVCELSFKQLTALAYSLFELYPEAEDAENSKQWRSLLSRALEAEGFRNRLLHSTFGVSIGDEAVFSRSKITAKFKKGMREDVESLDDAAMTAYRQNISAVGNEILDFMCRVFPKWNTRSWKREGASANERQ